MILVDRASRDCTESCRDCLASCKVVSVGGSGKIMGRDMVVGGKQEMKWITVDFVKL